MSNPVGAPTDYRPEYCQQLIQHRKNGFSYESFAATINVCRATLYAWERAFPEFSDAKKRAKEMHLLFMENVSQGLMRGIFKGNPAIWIFIMLNQHGWSQNPAQLGEPIDEIEFDCDPKTTPEEPQ